MDIIISCIIIFLLRVTDTTVSTLCTMFVSQGNKKIAPIVGCIQTVTWVIALNMVMIKLHESHIYLIIYAIAYGCGVLTGIIIEEKIASGDVLVQAVINEEQKELVTQLRTQHNLIVTVLDGQGKNNEKRLVLLIAVKRKKVAEIRKFLRDHGIFMTITKSQTYLNI